MTARPLRIVTAVAAFDGHDASISALNRALLAGDTSVEVIYLGFNMTGEQIASAAQQEGADAVAVASYNGGHLQFYPHLLKCLADRGIAQTLVFGGGGGTILPEDAKFLESSGVTKIYLPGWPLDAVATDVTNQIAKRLSKIDRKLNPKMSRLLALSRTVSLMVNEELASPPPWLRTKDGAIAPAVVIAGAGGTGKSTLIDELVERFLATFPKKTIAVLANDPTIRNKKTVCALLAAHLMRHSALPCPRSYRWSDLLILTWFWWKLPEPGRAALISALWTSACLST